MTSVVDLVADAFGVPAYLITSADRRRHVVRARIATAWVLRRSDMSLHEIGRQLNRDHSTIIHQLASADMLRAHDDLFKQATDRMARAYLAGQICRVDAAVAEFLQSAGL